MGLIPEAVKPECKYTWGLRNAWGFLPHNVSKLGSKEVSKREAVESLRREYDKSDLVNKKKTLTDILTYSPTHFKKAFTFAEVLITLGIIGIIAALTIPLLLQKYKAREYSAQLKKFYSSMSQAVIMSENVNGPALYWERTGNIVDEEGKLDVDAGFNEGLNFFKKYIAPYYKYDRIEKVIRYSDDGMRDSGNVKVYLLNGSTLTMWNGGCFDLIFDINGDRKPNEDGRDIFTFMLCQAGSSHDYWFDDNDKLVFVPYGGGLVHDRETALNKCELDPVWCSTLLQFDNWEFKDDYPYKN